MFTCNKFAANDFSLNGWETKVRQTPIDAASNGVNSTPGSSLAVPKHSCFTPLISLRRADVFPVVASLPPRKRSDDSLSFSSLVVDMREGLGMRLGH